MIIQNLTQQIQEISVLDRVSNPLTYSIYIKANDTLELDQGLSIMNLQTLLDNKILKIISGPMFPNLRVETTVSVEDVTTPDIVEEDVPEESSGLAENSTEEVVVDQFICPHCNEEFASKRSLSMHINKVHK